MHSSKESERTMSNSFDSATTIEQSIEIEDLIITDEDLMDVQLRARMDVGH